MRGMVEYTKIDNTQACGSTDNQKSSTRWRIHKGRAWGCFINMDSFSCLWLTELSPPLINVDSNNIHNIGIFS